jgi:hypothetical protein
MRVPRALVLLVCLAGCPTAGTNTRDGDSAVEVSQPGGGHCDRTEIPYDGIDQDCVDGDLVDVDQDGVDASEVGGVDCDDGDPLSYPGAPDATGDGVDQDCDGLDGVDADRDGYASVGSGGPDCDDADAAVHPGATETWYDAVDQDCDGACDGDQDGDGSVLDGWVVTDGDPCDADPAVDVVLAPVDCDDADPLAEALLVSTAPADGATDPNPWRPVRATLTDVDPVAALELRDADGALVPGSSAWVGSTLVLTPSAWLEPLAAYTATLTWACGTESWTFTTNDGSGQDFLHDWSAGAPDSLVVTLVNPTATFYGFGMAETAAADLGWYGEDCAGALSTGACHPMTEAGLTLETTTSVGLVLPGFTTLFDAASDPDLTYYVEARDGPDAGACWAWGQDPSYFPGCDAI